MDSSIVTEDIARSLGLDDVSEVTQVDPPTPLSDEKPEGYVHDDGTAHADGPDQSPQSNPVSYGDDLGPSQSEYAVPSSVDLHLPQLVRLETVLMDEICAVNDNVDQLRRDFEDIKVFLFPKEYWGGGGGGGRPQKTNINSCIIRRFLALWIYMLKWDPNPIGSA